MYSLVIFLIIASATSNEVFIEDPCPGPVRAPIGGEPVQINCSVIEGYEVQAWSVSLPGRSFTTTNTEGILEALMSHGISVQTPSARTSYLIINATEGNNGIITTCRAVGSDPLDPIDSGEVEVILYGPPSTPTNLTVSRSGVGSLRLSWFSIPIEGVSVWFTLNITNLDDTSTGSIILSGIQQQYYIFTPPGGGNTSVCDEYTFQVTALNDAGPGNSSDIITSIIPSLPDISPLVNSLEDNLIKTEGNIILNVTFEEATFCPEYPVINSTLILKNISGGRREIPIDGVHVIIMLMDNSRYHYYIIVTNEIGSVETDPIELVTTDVQGVHINIVEDTSYSIQCSFINGSDARGCVFILVGGEEGVANITGVIYRNSSEEVLIDIGCYSEVLAFDLESDNTTGTLPVRGNITSVDMTLCRPTGEGGRQTNIVLIIVLVILLPAFLVVVIITVIIVIYLYRRGKPYGATVKGQDSLKRLHDKNNVDEVNTQELNIPKKTVNELDLLEIPKKSVDEVNRKKTEILDKSVDQENLTSELPVPKNQEVLTSLKSSQKVSFKVQERKVLNKTKERKVLNKIQGRKVLNKTKERKVLNKTQERKVIQEEDKTEALYSTLSTKTSTKKVPQTKDMSDYSTLNTGPIYQVLENTKDANRKPASDLDAPPIPPQFCPAGGDSPVPELGAHHVELVEYAEVTSHGTVMVP